MSKNKCKTPWCNNLEFRFYKYCKSCLEKRKQEQNKKEEEIKKIEEKPINGQELKDLRKNFEASYRTEDWHYVRSKAEQLIDNWLYNRGIPHAYEKRVPIEELVYSDFFIPIWKKVYIEYWGLEQNPKYRKRKELKINFYKENNKNLIELTDKDIENLDDIMPVRLRPYLPTSFNFD